MGKKPKELNWTPVHLDGGLLNDMEGLIGIEECVDYNTDDVVSSKKTKKRKNEANFSELYNKDDKTIATNDLQAKRIKVVKKKGKTPKDQKKQNDAFDFSPSKRGSTDFDVSGILEANEIAEENMETETADFSAWNNFGLSKSLLKAIKDLNFLQPTSIQALTLPPAILGRRDILGAAETGSGKTLAFGLPILTGILQRKEKEQNLNISNVDSDEDDFEEDLNELTEQGTGCVKVVNNIETVQANKKPLYALILTPTRELAIQVKNHLVAVAKYTGIKVAVVLGGMAVEKQERILKKGPEIVVATPGRLWELIQEGNAHLSQVNDIRFLAIDETDRMVERGHFKELHNLLERINFDEHKRKERQNFVFSATLTLVHELPKYLALKKKIRNSKKIGNLTSQQKLQQIVDLLGINNPKIVDVTQSRGTAETLSECRITCSLQEKDYYVYYFLQKHPGRTLIFCNSIGCVKRLATLLGLLGCNPLPLHASMQQRQRLKNLDRFKDDENGILIATDVAARGLDIPCVEHVLHYQTPRTSESYVHRSGRTARASRRGITVLIVEPGELQNYLRLCRTLGRTEDLPLFPVQANFLEAVKQRIRVAREIDKLDLQVRKTNSESGWLQKAAEEMDILLDDNISAKYDTAEACKAKKAAIFKRKQLADLLAKPLFPRGFSGKYPLVSAELGMPLESLEKENERALEVLQYALEGQKKSFRNKAKWLFKGKKEENKQKNIKLRNSRKGPSKEKKIKKGNPKNKNRKFKR